MTDLPPLTQPPPEPPTRARRRTVLIAAIVAWGVLLTAIGIYAAKRGTPTVREQTTIIEALPTLDRVVTGIATIATGAGGAAGISGYERVGGACGVAPGRSGERYERSAYVYTPLGEETRMLRDLAAGAPRAWRLAVHRNTRITGDAGFYVRVEGAVIAPGRIRINASTGCRERGGTVPVPAGPEGPAHSAADVLVAGFGGTGVTWRGHRATCADGRTLWSVEATADLPAPAPQPTNLIEALDWSKEGIVALPELHVRRVDGVSQVVRIVDRQVLVQATTGCQ